ncbi:MAG TPA: response regulator transcription factor [Nitrospiria bacterium]|nr:response regulator transcription factor [Nitrospiria bacterium]
MEQKLLNIFLIDDDEKMAGLLKTYLKDFNIALSCETDPREGIKKVSGNKFHLLILDIMLPGLNGFDVCREIRKTSKIPIIMLTARGDTADKIVGLEIGADDYLPKPFEPRELVARIQSILRRSIPGDKTKHASALISGELRVDLNSREVFLEERILPLSTTEFDLLKLFMTHSGQAMNRDFILEQTKGIDWEAYNRSIDIAISRLRHKLGETSKNPRFIKTIWGEGYMYVLPVKVKDSES